MDFLSDHPLVSHDLGLRADITTVIYYDAEVSIGTPQMRKEMPMALCGKKGELSIKKKNKKKKAPALKKCMQP